MDLPPGIATEGLTEPAVREYPHGSRAASASPATIVLVAAAIGLAAGFVDLGLMVVKRRLIDGGFYHLGEHFGWIIPAGVMVLVMAPAAVLALIARLRPGAVRPGLAVAVLSFVGYLDVSARLPLELWASLLFSGGLAVQSARLVDRCRGRLEKLARVTALLLGGALLTIMLTTIGGRAWSEHRAVTALPPPAPAARNVLLIVWDTVRAANMSAHGYGRRTSPNLETLAGRGVRFDLAFATSSWTLPSHASIFTGRWPHELGVDWRSPLRDDVPTLALYLAAHGYDTGGFVANLDYCSRETGLARGFAHFDDYPINPWDVFTRYIALGRRLEVSTWAIALNHLLEKLSGHSRDLVPRSLEHAKDGQQVDLAFLHWLSWQQTRRRPFFAFLNFNDAHSPYAVPDRSAPGFGLRPASFRERLTLMQWNMLDKARLSVRDVRMATDVYDESISYLDRRLEALLLELGRRGVLDDTLVVVTSDHGEHLGDHRLFFHGCSLYRQVVEVPLVIMGPDLLPARRVVTEPVSLRDVPATVVDLLGLGRDAPFPGRSLARFWVRDQVARQPPAEPLLMETGRPIFLTNQGREPAAKGPIKSLVAAGMHYIRSADGREELYSLKSDPEERFNLAAVPMAREALHGFQSTLSVMLKRR